VRRDGVAFREAARLKDGAVITGQQYLVQNTKNWWRKWNEVS